MFMSETAVPFDPAAEGWRADMVKGFVAYQCAAPYAYAWEGELRFRPCKRCKGCIARDKRDRASRAAAEAHESAEVLGFTLTYRNGEPGVDRWCIEDVQRFMHRLRQRVYRDTLARLGIRERQLRLGKREVWTVERVAWIEAWNQRIKEEVPQLFYLRVGELGTRRKRRHFHLMVFSDRPLGIAASPAKPPRPGRRRGELQRETRPELWDHGFVSVDVMAGGKAQDFAPKLSLVEYLMAQRERRVMPSVSSEDAVRLCRYLQKYLEKSRGLTAAQKRDGKEPEVVYGMSLRRPLGIEWLKQEARRTAEAGLPLSGRYYVPGMRFSRASSKRARTRDGRPLHRGAFIQTGDAALDADIRGQWEAARTGDHQQGLVLGVSRRYVIEAFRDRWRELHGDRPMPYSDFVKWFDQERAAGDYRMPARSVNLPREKVEPKASLPPYRVAARKRIIELVVDGMGLLGRIKVFDTGAAKFLAGDGERCRGFLPAGDLSAQLPMLNQIARTMVERELFLARGLGWIEPRHWLALAADKVWARDAAVRGFAKDSELMVRTDLPPLFEPTGLKRMLDRRGDAHHGIAIERMKGEATRGPFRRQKLVLPRGSCLSFVSAIQKGAIAELAALPIGSTRRGAVVKRVTDAEPRANFGRSSPSRTSRSSTVARGLPGSPLVDLDKLTRIEWKWPSA